MTTHFLEASIVVRASADAIQAVYADVSQWPAWDPDTRSARLDGPFQVGAKGWLRPRKGLPVRMTVTHIDANGGFTVQSPVLGSRMTFEHLLVPGPDGVTVTHRVLFTGWLAGWLMHLVGKDLKIGLPQTLQGLKQRVERVASAQSAWR